MDAEKRNTSDLKAGLAEQLKRDKKKTAVLLVLVVVGGIVGAKAVFKHAAPGPAAAAAAAAAPTPSPQHDGVGRLASRLGMAGRNSDAARQEYLAKMDRTITRDLFQPNLAYFPLRPGKAASGAAAPGVQGWFGGVRERVLEKQRAQSEHMARVQGVCLEARKLSLTSIMLGSAPAAVIDGRVVRKGETCSGFRVESIGSKTCTLSKDGVRVDLTMER